MFFRRQPKQQKWHSYQVQKLTFELMVDKVHLPDDVILPIGSWSRSRVKPINLAVGSRQIILEYANFFL